MKHHAAVEQAGSLVETLRILTRSQNDLSPVDVSRYWSDYEGPVEGAEFMFLQGLIPSESDIDCEEFFPPLATILRRYAIHPSQWENLLRLVLRKGIGLHTPFNRWQHTAGKNTNDLSYPCEILDNGTPLDELFLPTNTPLEGEEVAARWLQVLSSQGYDVEAYLQEESALHAQQMQLTLPSGG